MSSNTQFKRLVKRVILWSVIVGGVLALLIPTAVKSSPTPNIHSAIGFSIEVSAQEKSPCELFGNCLTGTPTETSSTENVGNNITTLILNIALILTYISAAVAVLFLIIGGYLILTSAGDSGRSKQGVDTLKNAVIGLVITITAYAIVNFIVSVVQGFSL